MFFGKMAGGIVGDVKTIAGAVNKSIHRPVGYQGAHWFATGIAIGGIAGDRNIDTSADAIIEAPEKNGGVAVVPRIVVSVWRAEEISGDGPAGDALPA